MEEHEIWFGQSGFSHPVPTVHNVKSWPMLFQPAIEGRKLHDFRNAKDRDYKVWDILNLQEFDPATGKYTGREAAFLITYITSPTTPCALSSAVLMPGFCVLSIAPIPRNA